MTRKPSRRDFNKLTAAAFGGIVTGSLAGCGGGDGGAGSTGADGGTAEPTAPEVTVGLEEKHVCRGLNACKGQGAGAQNACAGQGSCATAVAHSCASQNACKGQGGCGASPGENACKGQGSCSVPLKGDMWTKARQRFEEKMKADGKQFGDAPAAN